jgi:hypothetical protein
VRSSPTSFQVDREGDAMISPTSRVVRVFISSTFRDFGAERDLLI